MNSPNQYNQLFVQKMKFTIDIAKLNEMEKKKQNTIGIEQRNLQVLSLPSITSLLMQRLDELSLSDHPQFVINDDKMNELQQIYDSSMTAQECILPKQEESPIPASGTPVANHSNPNHYLDVFNFQEISNDDNIQNYQYYQQSLNDQGNGMDIYIENTNEQYQYYIQPPPPIQPHLIQTKGEFPLNYNIINSPLIVQQPAPHSDKIITTIQNFCMNYPQLNCEIGDDYIKIVHTETSSFLFFKTTDQIDTFLQFPRPYYTLGGDVLNYSNYCFNPQYQIIDQLLIQYFHL